MITKDLKKLLQKLNDHTTRALEAAAGFSISRGHYEVTIEHLLLKLMEDGGGDVPRILNHFEVKDGQLWEATLKHLEGFKTGNTGRPTFSPLMLQLVESAWIVTSLHHGLAEIRSGALLEALIESPSFQSASYMDTLSKVNRDALREEFFDIVAGSAEDQASRRMSGRPTLDGAPAQEGDTALAQFTTNVTQKARDGLIDPVSGRDEEIRQIIDILSRRRKNNPILVGEPGVGKTAVIEGFALRIANGDVPDSLKEVEIHGLDLGLLQAGAGVKGAFEQRLKSVIQEVREAAKPIIMFIDEAHTLIGAGGSAGTGDAANLIKPALARGEMRTLAATTWSEYKKYIEKDPALERRFQLVKIDQPTTDNAITMLRGIKKKYEEHHSIPISDDAVQAAVELSARYVAGRQLPDKAVDLLDTATARVKMSWSAKPALVDDAERTLAYLDIEIAAVEHDIKSGIHNDQQQLEGLYDERKELVARLEELDEQWAQEQGLVEQITSLRAELSRQTNGEGEAIKEKIRGLQDELDGIQGEEPLIHAEVNAKVAAEVVADWTGIPAGSMEKDEAQVLLEMEGNLQEVIIGQNEAIKLVSEAIRTSKAGLKDPDAPHAVFLFVGPSGVGKTELALQVADHVFGGEKFLTTINMSEYQESHTTSQLKGAPPGYVGYGEGGILTEAVRRQPYSVVLLDEVEKAHRDVMNLFYQVFDKGFMRDGEGREIDFKNTIIIMTSNLASDIIQYVVSEDERPDADQIREAIHERLADHFQPALLGRMKVVPFYPLLKDPMKVIVKLKLNKINKRLRAAHDISFEYDPDVVERIAERCTQVDTGARNIDFIIGKNVLPDASRALISRMADENLPSKLTLGLDELGNFTYTFDDEEPISWIAPAAAEGNGAVGGSELLADDVGSEEEVSADGGGDEDVPAEVVSEVSVAGETSSDDAGEGVAPDDAEEEIA